MGVLGYLLLGAVVVCWRAQNLRVVRSDVDLLAVFLLWPFYVMAFAAYSYGYRRR